MGKMELDKRRNDPEDGCASSRKTSLTATGMDGDGKADMVVVVVVPLGNVSAEGRVRGGDCEGDPPPETSKRTYARVIETMTHGQTHAIRGNSMIFCVLFIPGVGTGDALDEEPRGDE